MQSLKLSISVLIILFLCSFTVFSAVVFEDDFETNKGWVTNPNGTDNATTGFWERANPEGTSYSVTMQLGTTHSGYYDLVTEGTAGSGAGSYDIDGGVTSIRSPSITLPAGGTITLSFYYYLAHYSNSSSADFLRVKIVGSTTQLVFEELGAANTDGAAWDYYSTDISSFAGQNVYVLIEAADASGGSLVEAGVDDVLIEATSTSAPPVLSDIPGQTIQEGENFTRIVLTDYVTDDDTPKGYLEWTASGQVNLTVEILMAGASTRTADITYPVGWTGSETVTFTVTDPELNTDSDDATFTVSSPQQYTLTTSTTGCPEGTITLNPTGPTYLAGTEVTCTASPQGDFINWTGDPIDGSNAYQETIVMNANYSITANFEAVCAPPAGTWVEDANGIHLDPNTAHVGIGTDASHGYYTLQVNGLINCTGIESDQHQDFNIVTPRGEFLCNRINVGSDIWAGIITGGEAKIDGPVYAREVIVTMDPFPDYVFSTGYNLKPLAEVEDYINKNKHLPGITSAGEVKENGLSLGEMQAKLLEKIEEMTLHMIQMQKRIDELENQVK